MRGNLRRLFMLGMAMLLAGAPLAQDKPDYSAAERLLFMSNHLQGLEVPATLKYSFRKSGSFEAGFQDTVSVTFARQADGSCCAVSGEFLSGARRMSLPEVENAEANPVTMFFLEHDVRDMQRLTKGQPNHFRKRIRMAIYNEAKVAQISMRYRGRDIAAQEIRVSPYLNDSSRPRFEKFAQKDYVFTLSSQVPGRVAGIRSVVAAASPAEAPLIVEELLLEGAELSPAK